jgi:type I restriction enzyme R subunit
MTMGITEANLNEFGRFDELRDSVDTGKAREYFEKIGGTRIPPFKVNMKVHDLLRRFILLGGIEI